MTVYLSPSADTLLNTIQACSNQVFDGILMPEGAYGEAYGKLRLQYSEEEIVSALRSMRENQQFRENAINLEGSVPNFRRKI